MTVLVDPKDGKCFSCGSQLRIIDAEETTMEAECTECGEVFTVEPDAFGDGGIDYWPRAMVEKENKRDDDF